MRARRCIAAALAAAALAVAAGAVAAELPEAASIAGTWSGARLQCQKEEGRLVRCGTPAPFTVTFDAAGAGSSPGGSLPEAFAWRWLSDGEIAVTPAGGGEEVKLFGVERDEDMLTFQAYVYLPTADPNAPPEARYIHYIFDVTREE